VFDVKGAHDGRPLSARTCFDYRQVIAPRSIVERMNINEITELSVSPSSGDVVLINVGRRYLLAYSADNDAAVAADVAALRRWYEHRDCENSRLLVLKFVRITEFYQLVKICRKTNS